MDLAEPKPQVIVLWADTFEWQGTARDFRVVAIHDVNKPGEKPRLEVQIQDEQERWCWFCFKSRPNEPMHVAIEQMLLGGIYQAGLVQGRKVGIEQERQRCFDVAVRLSNLATDDAASHDPEEQAALVKCFRASAEAASEIANHVAIGTKAKDVWDDLKILSDEQVDRLVESFVAWGQRFKALKKTPVGS